MMEGEEVAPGPAWLPYGIAVAPWAVAVISVCGTIALWWRFAKKAEELDLKNKNLATENQKLKAETTRLQTDCELLKAQTIESGGETLVRLQAADTAYRDAAVHAKRRSRALLTALQEASPDLQPLHDEFCEAVGAGMLHAHYQHFQWLKLVHGSSPSWKDLCENVIIAELENIASMVRTCNHPSFALDYGWTRFKVSPSTVYPFRALLDSIPAAEQERVRVRLDAAIQSLLDA